MEETLTLMNRRGQNLKAIINFSDSDGDKTPTVVLLQGFLGKMTGEKLTSISNHLAQLGITNIRFDYAGFGQSEGDPEMDYRVSNILSDMDTIYAYLINEKRVDKEKIGVWGQSMGAMLAILFASGHHDIKAVCAVSPPSQITRGDDLEKIIFSWKQNGYLSRLDGAGKPFKLPFDFVDDAQKYDAKLSVNNITSPILIILGTQDSTVPPQVSSAIYQNANEPKKLIRIEGMVHDYKEQPEFLEKVNNLSGDFFVKQLT